MKKVMECSQAIAEAVKLSNVDVVPMYPITPQTHIVERIAEMIADGEIKTESILVESEHSALSAALGSTAVGARTFTATSSQGLALMHEILFIVSGLRLPIVMAVANRALSSPINIWNDHSDSIASRDSGWIQLYVESSQEAYDTTLQAFKIAETARLPIMICVDGFTLSHVWEPVDFMNKSLVGKYNPKVKLDPSKPITMGAIAFPDTYMEFKKQQEEAMQSSLNIIKNVNKTFKRKYGNGLIEEYKTSGASTVILCMGSMCGTVRVLIDQLRSKGIKIGMLKLRSYRPFPREDLIKSLKNIKTVKVIDRSYSYGNAGALYTEVRDALYNTKVNVEGFVMGLGGKDINLKDLEKVVKLKGGWI